MLHNTLEQIKIYSSTSLKAIMAEGDSQKEQIIKNAEKEIQSAQESLSKNTRGKGSSWNRQSRRLRYHSEVKNYLQRGGSLDSSEFRWLAFKANNWINPDELRARFNLNEAKRSDDVTAIRDATAELRYQLGKPNRAARVPGAASVPQETPSFASNPTWQRMFKEYQLEQKAKAERLAAQRVKSEEAERKYYSGGATPANLFRTGYIVAQASKEAQQKQKVAESVKRYREKQKLAQAGFQNEITQTPVFSLDFLPKVQMQLERQLDILGRDEYGEQSGKKQLLSLPIATAKTLVDFGVLATDVFRQDTNQLESEKAFRKKILTRPQPMLAAVNPLLAAVPLPPLPQTRAETQLLNLIQYPAAIGAGLQRRAENPIAEAVSIGLPIVAGAFSTAAIESAWSVGTRFKAQKLPVSEFFSPQTAKSLSISGDVAPGLRSIKGFDIVKSYPYVLGDLKTQMQAFKALGKIEGTEQTFTAVTAAVKPRSKTGDIITSQLMGNPTGEGLGTFFGLSEEASGRFLRLSNAPVETSFLPKFMIKRPTLERGEFYGLDLGTPALKQAIQELVKTSKGSVARQQAFVKVNLELAKDYRGDVLTISPGMQIGKMETEALQTIGSQSKLLPGKQYTKLEGFGGQTIKVEQTQALPIKISMEERLTDIKKFLAEPGSMKKIDIFVENIKLPASERASSYAYTGSSISASEVFASLSGKGKASNLIVEIPSSTTSRRKGGAASLSLVSFPRKYTQKESRLPYQSQSSIRAAPSSLLTSGTREGGSSYIQELSRPVSSGLPELRSSELGSGSSTIRPPRTPPYYPPPSRPPSYPGFPGYQLSLDYPKKPPSKLKKKKDELDLFGVQVRKGGKFITLKSGLTLGKAFNLGLAETRKTPRASFRVIKGGQVVSLPELSTPSGFRRSKREKGVLIEKTAFRINAPAEFSGITGKGLTTPKRKKRKKRL